VASRSPPILVNFGGDTPPQTPAHSAPLAPRPSRLRRSGLPLDINATDKGRIDWFLMNRRPNYDQCYKYQILWMNIGQHINVVTQQYYLFLYRYHVVTWSHLLGDLQSRHKVNKSVVTQCLWRSRVTSRKQCIRKWFCCFYCADPAPFIVCFHHAVGTLINVVYKI